MNFSEYLQKRNQISYNMDRISSMPGRPDRSKIAIFQTQLDTLENNYKNTQFQHQQHVEQTTREIQLNSIKSDIQTILKTLEAQNDRLLLIEKNMNQPAEKPLET